jgi:hypothetical protein
METIHQAVSNETNARWKTEVQCSFISSGFETVQIPKPPFTLNVFLRKPSLNYKESYGRCCIHIAIFTELLQFIACIFSKTVNPHSE